VTRHDVTPGCCCCCLLLLLLLLNVIKLPIKLPMSHILNAMLLLLKMPVCSFRHFRL
jgi:hypothetical protein